MASNDGYLKTFNWKGSKKEAILKPAISGGYYKTVLINDDGIYKSIVVHRIIAMAWIDNPNNLKTVNHKNGNKLDNRVINLEWLSHIDNCRHYYNSPHIDPVILRGEKNGFSKLTEKQVKEIRDKYKPHIITKKMLASEYGVLPSCIKDIVQRRSWRHI